MIGCSSTTDYSEAIAYLRGDVLINIGLLNSLQRNVPPVPKQVWVARGLGGGTVGVIVLEEMPHGRFASLHARSPEAVEALLRCLGENRAYPVVVCGGVSELLRTVVPRAKPESINLVMTLAHRDLCQVDRPGEIRRLTPADKALTDAFSSPRPTLTEFVQWAADDPSKSVVFGLGILGQLQEQILRAWGCRTLAADQRRERLAVADALGCGHCVDTTRDDLAAAARALAPEGLDGVIVNTALQPPMMDQAAAACRERGRIVMVGGGREIRVSREHVFAKELDLLISRAGGPGRYDLQYEKHGQDLPTGFVRWTEGRNTAHFLEMVANGQVTVTGLITHRVPREQAPQMYELLGSESRYGALGVVFVYD